MTYLYRESSELEAGELRGKCISMEAGLSTCVRRRTESAAGMNRECIELRPQHPVAIGPGTDAGGRGETDRAVLAQAHVSVDALITRGWREISADEGRRFLQNASPPARRVG
jgi:hypothetical protein